MAVRTRHYSIRTEEAYVPARRISLDPRSGEYRRHHFDECLVQRAFAGALRAAKIAKHAGVHSLRHSFATHLLEDGYDIRGKDICAESPVDSLGDYETEG